MNDLNQIFETVKSLLNDYQPPYTPHMQDETHFDLWSHKDLVIDGRKRKEIFFVGLIIQKGYVGFYYMPVYAEPEMKSIFAPELLKLLKGKSCFHIKKLDDALIQQIRHALADGHALYLERGWVDAIPG